MRTVAMHDDVPLTRDLVLIGGGHAHALVLRRWGMAPLPGVRLTVVNPGATAPYTGMLPGHVAGHYARDELDIDLVRLCRFAGAALIDGAVTAIDPDARRVTVPGRPSIVYDVASLDIGIHSEMPDLPGFAAHGVGAKPLGRFAHEWRSFRAAVAAGARPAEAAVIGGGVAGVELAMAMAHALRADGARPTVTVLEQAPGINGVGTRARDRLMDAMRGLGVAFRGGVAVAALRPDAVVLRDGGTVPAAFVTGAAGARPHAWLRETGLPHADGFVRVGPTLAVEGRSDLFAAGDCAHLAHAPRPKAGVYAVRAAPILAANLRDALAGRSPRRHFAPQRTYLKLISLGGRSALAEKAGLVVTGPWIWRWKDRIDRAFMEKLTTLPAMTRRPPAEAAAGVAELAKPLCAGCGAKVGGGALSAALAKLPPARRAEVLSRPGDDAAVLDLGSGRRQVLTTDHLRAITRDDALMARIATVHALGDVWAMGAAPQAALASLTLSRASEALQARTLDTILAEMADVLGAVGADLVGGHTTMGAEPVFGLTISGLADTRPIGLDGARPGDALILTRPIGSGVILAAEMAGAARGRDVQAMLQAMARPQADAAAILRQARAMTDVTGFGLAGHLANICRASGLRARIALQDIPIWPGAEALAEAGHASVLRDANARTAPVFMQDGAADGHRIDLMHDPQTAGGLLAAVPSEAAAEVLSALDGAGGGWRIGTLVEGPPGVDAV